MASFFNVGGLGGNPFSTPVGQRIEQATDGSLTSENWALNMEICDMINDSSDTARDAMKAMRKRLVQNAGKNNQVIMYTLTVLETCVKNCGKAFHVLVASKEFIQELVKLIGPKNDPPAAVQEKVLSLIQVWADAFKNQPDLNGVSQVYVELKNKGIEFPQPDMETMAPIYTPQRSVPELQPQAVAQSVNSPQHAPPTTAAHNNGPVVLTAEKATKLQSELEVVSFSMSILGEMLNELKPGQEDPNDYVMLTELTGTCKEMQNRIVELIGRINDDEITAELLRCNDEFNNLFLRQQRYEKNRSSCKAAASPSAILGAAIGIPSAMGPGNAANIVSGNVTANAAVGVATSATSSSPTLLPSMGTKLIDLANKNETLEDSFAKFAITSTQAPVPPKDADEFDMLAQSRSDGTNKTDLKDIPSVDAAAGSINAAPKRTGEPPVVSKLPSKDSDFDEMEAWLSNSKEADGIEEILTSTEFEKFLQERAAAAENLPNVTLPSNNGNNSNNTDENQRKTTTTKSKHDEGDLLQL